MGGDRGGRAALPGHHHVVGAGVLGPGDDLQAGGRRAADVIVVCDGHPVQPPLIGQGSRPAGADGEGGLACIGHLHAGGLAADRCVRLHGQGRRRRRRRAARPADQAAVAPCVAWLQGRDLQGRGGRPADPGIVGDIHAVPLPLVGERAGARCGDAQVCGGSGARVHGRGPADPGRGHVCQHFDVVDPCHKPVSRQVRAQHHAVEGILIRPRLGLGEHAVHVEANLGGGDLGPQLVPTALARGRAGFIQGLPLGPAHHPALVAGGAPGVRGEVVHADGDQVLKGSGPIASA